MKPKRTSAASDTTTIRVVVVTLDSHLASATDRAQHMLLRELPGLRLSLHAASDWGEDAAALAACRADIAQADILVVTMMFMDDHVRLIQQDLRARREQCDALVACMSGTEIVRLTRAGRFAMDKSVSGPLALLRRLRGRQQTSDGKPASAGAQQLKMLRRIPQILRFIPGTAQDVRAYFLTLQYWLAGTDDNIANLVRLLVSRYADGPRRALRDAVNAQPPREFPDVGVYHPRMKNAIAENAQQLPARTARHRGSVGLLVMRSYVLAGNTRHYDGVIAALEARGLHVVPAFSCGLDARPAVQRFFVRDGRAVVDAVVSLTGFSLVGGPAYNDARAAEAQLAALDVPYLAAHPVEFQTLAQWEQSERGLLPVESTIMIAIPELDGAVAPMVFGGRGSSGGADGGRDMQAHPERVAALASRVAKLVELRATAKRERRVGIVLFNFPPNAGNVGTAAHLAVFESLYNTLAALRDDGYAVEMPASVAALRTRLIEGNAARFGALANVHARVPTDEHVRRERWLAEIERHWGPAPGKVQADGASVHVLGERFGNVFVGVQPGFGYEGDPMRLLFEKGFAPTHAFAAFYRWLREDFAAHVLLHFGTHGALEFMPGKQNGLSSACWPERLIGDLPNVYLYAANNPSEGTIAKRRAAATLVSYLTPPVAHAGLYRGLHELRATLDQWRSCAPDDAEAAAGLAELIQSQAAALDLANAAPAWGVHAEAHVAQLVAQLHEFEQTLIPHGLHVVGVPPDAAARGDLLLAVAAASHGVEPSRAAIAALVDGLPAAEAAAIDAPAGDVAVAERRRVFEELAGIDRLLATDHELPAVLRALDGRFVPPAPGGDLLRTPAMLPTGRNLHGFDPFRLPSAWAVADGARQAERLLQRHRGDGHAFPESIALVLWGTDNLKSEGGPIAQALALVGARPTRDGYGRLSGAELIPLGELGRPRIDVVMSVSGIFRDLLPLQIRLLAEACFLAASADEPLERNFVRKHALAYAARTGVDLETAALRVFSNADGAYGSNVSHLVDNGRWDDEDELAETYTRRKSFVYGRAGKPIAQPQLLEAVLADVSLAYQNLESVEVGVTTIDHYYDTLGGISRAIGRARRRDGAAAVPVYIGDQTVGAGTVRTLAEQVALETRTRALNPKWYEAMLAHGYEGVRHIEAHVTNTVGWSATTGQVAPWVYQQLTRTFVLDPAMRERLAALNPASSAKVAHRLLEAHERRYWTPDPATLAALQAAGDELEDRLEGVNVRMAA